MSLGVGMVVAVGLGAGVWVKVGSDVLVGAGGGVAVHRAAMSCVTVSVFKAACCGDKLQLDINMTSRNKMHDRFMFSMSTPSFKFYSIK